MSLLAANNLLLPSVGGGGGADPNLIGHWKLDELTGNIAYDSSPSGLDGTGSSGFTFDTWSVPGPVDTAANLLNIYSFDAGILALLNGGTQLSVAGWFKPQVNSVRRGMISQHAGSNATGKFTWDTAHLNHLQAQLAVMDGVNYRLVQDAGTTYTLGVWTHCVMTFDLPLDQGTLYVNGVPTSVLYSGTPMSSLNSSTLPLFIGRGNYGHASGVLDDIRLYDDILTAQEALDLYNLGTPP